MARRRGRRRSIKFRLNRQSSLSISSLFLLALGSITFISFFAQAASVNSVLQDLINRFFGWGAFFVPFILLLSGLLLGRSVKWAFVESRVLAGLVIFSLSFISIIHLFFRPESSRQAAQFGDGGGLVGFYIQNFLRNTVSSVGAFIILLSLFLVSLILIFDAPPQAIFDGFIRVFRSIVKSISNLFEKFGKNQKDEEEILETKEDDQGVLKVSQKEEKGESDFEIIPSFSEPINLEGKGNTGRGEEVLKQETVTNLPYSDRVWEYPSLDLFSVSPSDSTSADSGDVKRVAQIIEETLESFGVKARVVEVNIGPAVTQYALEAASGTKIAKITNLQHDLALALASPTGSVRIEAPIPGKSLIGIEVPNISPALVTLRKMLTSPEMKKMKSKLAVSLGESVSGRAIIADLTKMPHVLVAGSTGSGKSVLVHSMLATLLFRNSPSELKFILIDPKRVELQRYNGIPHLLTPVIVDAEKAVPSLKWALSEMNRRYRLLENAKARNIAAYNEMSGFQALPYIIIVVDEFADLMSTSPVDVEKSVIRLAQMARAVGIHLILATQRPSVDVLTGLIKANIPCRMALNTVSQIDSRVIIDQSGAEKLLGRGDMLYVPPDASRPIRIQGVFASDKELASLVGFLKSSNIKPEYKEEVVEFKAKEERRKASGPSDDLFREALEIVVLEGKASASLLQRKLSIGYARAARIIDEMESMNIVSKAEGSKPRDVLVTSTSQIFNKEKDDDTSAPQI